MKSFPLATLGALCLLFTGCRTMDNASDSETAAATGGGTPPAANAAASAPLDVARITLGTEDLAYVFKTPAIAYDANGREIHRLTNCAGAPNGTRCSDGVYEAFKFRQALRWTKIGDANAAPRFFSCAQTSTPFNPQTFAGRNAFDCKPVTAITDKGEADFFANFAKPAATSFQWAWNGNFLAAVPKDQAASWIAKVRAMLPAGTYEGIMSTAAKICEVVVSDTANGGLKIELATTSGGTRKKLDDAVLEEDTIRGAAMGDAREKAMDANSAVVSPFIGIDFQPLDTLKGDKGNYSWGTMMVSPKWEDPMSGKAGLYVQTQHAKYCRRMVKKS